MKCTEINFRPRSNFVHFKTENKKIVNNFKQIIIAKFYDTFVGGYCFENSIRIVFVFLQKHLTPLPNAT